MIKELIPACFCLKCDGCCRFNIKNSAWLLRLLDEDIIRLKNSGHGKHIDSSKKTLFLTSDSCCPFLEKISNKCGVYQLRPFECRLYPFLITRKGERILLSFDSNCRYLSGSIINSADFKQYCRELENFLKSGRMRKLFAANPHIAQEYDAVTDIAQIDPD